MIESFRAEQWLYSLLAGDTGPGGVSTLVGGRIYAYLAPSGAAFPLVVYSRQAGHDVMGLGTTRIMASARIPARFCTSTFRHSTRMRATT